jgi:molecular chaperone GrpE
MEGVYSQALSAAGGHGLTQFVPNPGDEFDPNKHEAVGVEQTDRNANDNHIVKVIQKGYELHGTIIRPAKVIIYSHEY